MANDSYLTVKGETEIINVIERSKFICKIKGVSNEDDAKKFIEFTRKDHPFATHVCYAYIADDLGFTQKFSDDGEPQGTAGMPMLEVLKNRKIFKVVAVVVRYFGGIKLGAGGLVRAYSGAVSDCLDKANVVSMEKVNKINITADYETYSGLLKILTNENCVVKDAKFEDKITVTVIVKTTYHDTVLAKLSDLFKGKPIIERLEDDYCAF